MRTPEGNKILSVLKGHIGADQSITAPEICAELGWIPGRDRRVRQIIADESALWEDLVCAKSGDGYFVAESFEEIETYHNWLAGLAISAMEKFEAFRKAAERKGVYVPMHAGLSTALRALSELAKTKKEAA